MAIIRVTEKTENASNLFYVQTTLSEILTQAGCYLENKNMGSRTALSLTVSDRYSEIVKTELADRLAEIIAIGYKYKFFKKHVGVKGLTDEQREILIASLISADFSEDKRYAYEKLKQFDEIPLDGIFNFRLQPLKNKWIEIVSYMPNCFVQNQLHDFIGYLIENRKKRVYLNDGKVYDGHYRKLMRAELLGGDSVKLIREVILSDCGEVEISGKIPDRDEYYLKEFYKDKIYFSTGYFS